MTQPIDIGDLLHWQALYERTVTVINDFNASAARMEEVLEMSRFVGTGQGIIVGTDPENPAGSLLEAIADWVQDGGDKSAQGWDDQDPFGANAQRFMESLGRQAEGARTIAGEMRARADVLAQASIAGQSAQHAMDAHYQQKLRAEAELGARLAGIPAEHYVVRAIGARDPRIPWDMVRAQIEIDRQLTQMTDLRRTLRRHRQEPWAIMNLGEVTLNIQRVQLLQIALSSQPLRTARGFGKETIFRSLGGPPEIVDVQSAVAKVNSDPWFVQAMHTIQVIEPARSGLVIDSGVGI